MTEETLGMTDYPRSSFYYNFKSKGHFAKKDLKKVVAQVLSLVFHKRCQ